MFVGLIQVGVFKGMFLDYWDGEIVVYRIRILDRFCGLCLLRF